MLHKHQLCQGQFYPAQDGHPQLPLLLQQMLSAELYQGVRPLFINVVFRIKILNFTTNLHWIVAYIERGDFRNTRFARK
jgi:hypothetical protein